MSTVRDALGGAVDALAVGVENPRLDAEVLLSEATGWDRTRLVADPDLGLEPAAGRLFGEMVRRRLRREPVAYVIGRKGFRRIELAVDRRVLIPRPESELLVELALELEPRTVLDVGTGSGALALAIADELPGCAVVATDTSAAALEVARGNAQRLGLADRVDFQAGTLPVGDQGEPREFDLIVANLPYVAERDWADLEPDVTQWEPREALLAGPDGLDAIGALIADPRLATSLSPPGCRSSLQGVAGSATSGAIGLEVGEGQAEAVEGMLRAAGFGEVESRPDLAGIPRLVWGQRR